MSGKRSRHALGEMVFELAFASEAEAFAQHEELAPVVGERLVQVIDEVFDELGGGAAVYRFDELELDLGELPRHGYQEEMALRLRARLRALLQARMPAAAAAATPGVAVVSRRRAELEIFLHFLDSGALPWNASNSETEPPERWALKVLRASGAEFVEFLKKKTRAHGRRSCTGSSPSFPIACW